MKTNPLNSIVNFSLLVVVSATFLMDWSPINKPVLLLISGACVVGSVILFLRASPSMNKGLETAADLLTSDVVAYSSCASSSSIVQDFSEQKLSQAVAGRLLDQSSDDEALDEYLRGIIVERVLIKSGTELNWAQDDWDRTPRRRFTDSSYALAA